MWTLDDFLNSSAGRETRWYADRDTNQVVGFCPSCEAELRFGIDGPSEWRFAHKNSCPYSDEKRAQRLVDGMVNVLKEETDSHVAFSSVTFLLATMCALAAEETGEPLAVWVKRFVRAFEERVGDVGPVLKIMVTAPETAA